MAVDEDSHLEEAIEVVIEAGVEDMRRTKKGYRTGRTLLYDNNQGWEEGNRTSDNET